MKTACLTALLLAASVTGAAAQTTAPPSPVQGQSPPGPAGSPYDRIWRRFTVLYDEPDNPVLQRVLFTGRLQHDFAVVEAVQGDAHEWNTRRLRLGPRITLFRSVTIHGEVELNPQEADPLYVRLTDMYVEWSRSPHLAVTVGKHSIPFTMDGATSSKQLLAIDRSNLANNMWFPQEYLPGASVSGERSAWTYHAGIYSAGAANREFGTFSGDAAMLLSLGYDFAADQGDSQALLSGHYVYQHPDVDNTFTRQLEHVGSITMRAETDRWGLRTDLSAAAGYGSQRDLMGVMAMPFLNVTPSLQIVGRYTFLDSDGPNGVQLATYENRVVSARGDRYDELYLGVNYYFYGHNLKLQTGVQFADMDDAAADGGAYSGTSWTTGLRVGW